MTARSIRVLWYAGMAHTGSATRYPVWVYNVIRGPVCYAVPHHTQRGSRL